MPQDADQQFLIDRAHEERNFPGSRSDVLTFAREPLNSTGLRLLAQQRPDLKGLFLMRTEIEDEGFDAINAFRDLEWLNVGETRLTNAAVRRIDPGLPLQKLGLAHGQVSPESLAHVAQIPTLRLLECGRILHYGERPSPPIDEALMRLEGMTWLEGLDVRGHVVRGPGLRAVQNLRALRFLALSMTSAPAHDLARLATLIELETLLLRGTGLDDAAMEALSVLRNLRHLDVSSTIISDRAVPSILALRELRALGFERLNVSRSAAERLFELPYLENLEIWIDGVESGHWRRLVENRPGFHLEA